MIFFFPTGTNAPLYHWPFATGGLMLLNIFVMILQLVFPDQGNSFQLIYGQIDPISWFTSIFMHADIGHLLGNLVGIGLFGWIIEGKVGWWRFLLIYLGIGAGSCAFEQTAMLFLGISGSSIGASGVVYGLIAMAMIWGPENEIYITGVGLLLWRPFMFTFPVYVSILALLMIGLEFTIALVGEFKISAAILHLVGAGFGFLFSFGMLKLRRVDCDGFDIISLLRNKRGERTHTVADEKDQQEQISQEKLDAQRKLTDGLQMVDKYIETGHYDVALKRLDLLKKRNRSLVLTEPQYVKIIRAFDADAATKLQTIPLLETYIQHYEPLKTTFTLMLARAHVLMQHRPRQGLKVLETLETLAWKDLNPKQSEFVKMLIAQATKMIDDGVLEVNE